MASLLNKLRMLEAEPKKPQAAPTSRTKTEEYDHQEGVFPLNLFADQKHASADVLESIFGCVFPSDVCAEDILFLDTETTGLSGGVGTIAFQIGLGYFSASGFVVEQLLMHDYTQEAPMLQRLSRLMKRFSILCTFNGRTFDVPLLKSRMLMNRISDASFPEIHADVLYPARRLWKLRLKRCTLGNLEEQLLHVQRHDDLPGALVPQVYFQYLKDGCFAPLQRVLDHNKQDIVSLAQLFFFLCKQVDRPEGMTEAEDLLSLARSMEKSGQAEKAMHCYRLSVKTSMRTDAYRAMARMEKRSGNIAASVKLYEAMLANGNDPIAACEGLAKLYEHQLHDLNQAISYTRKALLMLAEPSLFQNDAVQERQSALQYRYMRLRRKQSAQTTI